MKSVIQYLEKFKGVQDKESDCETFDFEDKKLSVVIQGIESKEVKTI